MNAQENPALAGIRVDYSGDQLLESEAPPSPYDLARAWLTAALVAHQEGRLVEPNAMVLSTCVAGRPRSRVVLLKELTADGFVFFSNYNSAKGSEMASHPAVGLLLVWPALHRQIRVEGVAEQVAPVVSDDYFATRPRGSQLGAWASPQSAEVGSAAELQVAYAQTERRFAGRPVPRPPHWGGYLVRPAEIEFWQGRPSRMHDRLRYRRESEPSSGWTITRLAP